MSASWVLYGTGLIDEGRSADISHVVPDVDGHPDIWALEPRGVEVGEECDPWALGGGAVRIPQTPPLNQQ
jgi:hypothetical protein